MLSVYGFPLRDSHTTKATTLIGRAGTRRSVVVRRLFNIHTPRATNAPQMPSWCSALHGNALGETERKRGSTKKKGAEAPFLSKQLERLFAFLVAAPVELLLEEISERNS